MNNTASSLRIKKPLYKRINVTAALSYASIAVLILSILSVGYSGEREQRNVFGAVSASAEEETSSIDQVAAAALAAGVAQATDISVEANVANLSTSLNARAALAQSNEDFASKPQMVSEAVKSAIVSYEVKDGDDLASIAAAFGVSVETIKWANDLNEDTVAASKKLRIPTVDGIVYTVKEGDTAKSLAEKYKASDTRIVSFNNAELSGLKAGQQVVIPGGVLPENERPGYSEPTAVYNGGYASGSSSSGSAGSNIPFTPSYGGGYPFGWCTYYAAAKGGAPGNWGNANTWDDFAYQSPGWTVSGRPVVGAIAQTDRGGGGYGHVAIVEAVSSDGRQIQYSDMNGISGFGGVGRSGWVPVSYFQAYIHR